MPLCNPLRAATVVTAALVSLTVWSSPAPAGTILDYRYTGVLTDFYDPYGVFAAVAPGDMISGEIKYSAPAPTPIDYGSMLQYPFPVTTGGGNLMTAAVGPLDLRSTQQLIVQVYDPVATGATGVDFQFGDADASQLNAPQLPPGLSVTGAGAYVGLNATDFGLSTFPNLPTSLAPLSLYDSPLTGSFLFADIRDSSGSYVDGAFVGFALTSLTAVPEPTTLTMVATAGLCALGYARCRRPPART